MKCWANGYTAIVPKSTPTDWPKKRTFKHTQPHTHTKKQFALWVHWIHFMTTMNGIHFKRSFESNWLAIVFLTLAENQQQQHADCEIDRYFSALLPNWTVHLEKLPMQHIYVLLYSIQWGRKSKTISHCRCYHSIFHRHVMWPFMDHGVDVQLNDVDIGLNRKKNVWWCWYYTKLTHIPNLKRKQNKNTRQFATHEQQKYIWFVQNKCFVHVKMAIKWNWNIFNNRNFLWHLLFCQRWWLFLFVHKLCQQIRTNSQLFCFRHTI